MTKRAGIMLCNPLEEKRLLKWNVSEVIVQPKLDGERCRAYWDHHLGRWTLESSEGNEFKYVPHINEALERMKVPHSWHLDGELYTHGMSFNDIHSIASRKTNAHSDAEMLEYHVFDLITHAPMGDRIVLLWDLNDDEDTPVKMVPSILCEATVEKIVDHMNAFVKWNYEGIIVRHPGAFYETRRSPYLMKFKPRKSDVYRIIGVNEEISIYNEPKGTLGAFTCCGDDDAPFNVGSGFTRDQRRDLWERREELIGQFVEVLYQHLTPAHIPRFPIFKCIIRREE